MAWKRCVSWVLGLAAAGCGPQTTELMNVSYDPTRELYKEINTAFCDDWKARTGQPIGVRQSHGSSSSQARSVLEGLDADVVTLALWPDTDALRQKGLIAEGWDKRLPNDSLPYYSTVVFLVRKGNPKGIHDWNDLVDPAKPVEIIAANPKTGGGARLIFLAAWGVVTTTPGKTDADAEAYVTEMYRRVKVLDPSARTSTVTFTREQLGDVHLNWENEAILAVEESKGELEIVYPSKSLRCEPKVSVVDATVDRKKTREQAEAYLQFLYTPTAQEIIARHHYRPTDPAVAEKHKKDFHPIELFEIGKIAPGGWGEAQERFFGPEGVFDRIYEQVSKPAT